MTPPSEATAKEQVLSWVRSKNPSTMELKMGCEVLNNEVRNTFLYNDRRAEVHYVYNEYDEHMFAYPDHDTTIIGSDMGLQELLIALTMNTADRTMSESIETMIDNYKITLWIENCYGGADYDLTKNLHNQEDSFYEALLPLIV